MLSIGNQLMRIALAYDHLPAALLDDNSKIDRLWRLFSA
jgi:hypothetical protein